MGIGALVASLSTTVTWEVYTDGATNRKGSRVGIMLVTPEKLIVEKCLHLGFQATNSETKYKILLAGMAMVSKLGGIL